MRLEHEFPPVCNENSKVLILGSFPSVKSREQHFYYGHPRNRFWPLMARLCEEELPQTAADKTALCLRHGSALWDVIESCDIEGSADSSIRHAHVNDLSIILCQCDIRQIFVNGTTAYQLFRKYQKNSIGRDAMKLPSTSPANAAWTFDKLFVEWSVIRAYLPLTDENTSQRHT